jgi:hypothetical protein
MRRVVIGAWLGFGGVGCVLSGSEEMTYGEALEALQATVDSGKGEALVSEPIEITTQFTLGQAAADAAQELRDWVASQLPCAELSLDGATLTMDLGTLDDACTYQGKTYAGVIVLEVVSADADAVLVRHTWSSLTDGTLTADGSADVTWTQDAATERHVAHEIVWTDDTGRVIDARGDRTQRYLDEAAGIWGGFGESGTRDWNDSETGDWSLDIDGIEVRWQDPVPQAGVYTLLNPDSKTLTMAFERVDDDTIRVTMSGTRDDLVFDVSAWGVITEVE